jgi:endo-1,4-beta-xylanase
MKPLFLTILLAAGTACSQEQPALKTAFKEHFLIGAALNPSQFGEANQTEAVIVKTQFNSITPENVMKWEPIHPRPGRYDFSQADKFVEFGMTNGMFVVGHTLVWHSQTPDWVFEDHGKPASRDVLLERMREHISTVVGRYKGKVKGWDVVNEALEGDGSLRQSPWRQIIGDDFIQKAFEFAHKADPDAQLYYNDFGLEEEPKREGVIALVKKLKAAGVKIDGVGIQEHVNLTWPTNGQLDATLTEFGKLGVKVMITELDVDVLPEHNWSGSAEVTLRLAADPLKNPYTNGLPADVQQTLARRYADLFAIYLKHSDKVSRVTLWGVTDGSSWLNNWPIPGRTSYPLLFDRVGKPKECFAAVIQTARLSPSYDSASSK